MDDQRTFEIKNRFTGALIFSIKVPNTVAVGREAAYSVEAAGKLNVSLARADLSNIDLRYLDMSDVNMFAADLRNTDMRSTDISGAQLSGADMRNADIRFATMSGTDICNADMRGAKLSNDIQICTAEIKNTKISGAMLGENKLVGERPIFRIGPIGSRNDYVSFFGTETGILVSAGCFEGSPDKFLDAVTVRHGDNAHAEEYRLAVELAKKHFAIWRAAPQEHQAAPTEQGGQAA